MFKKHELRFIFGNRNKNSEKMYLPSGNPVAKRRPALDRQSPRIE